MIVKADNSEYFLKQNWDQNVKQVSLGINLKQGFFWDFMQWLGTIYCYRLFSKTIFRTFLKFDMMIWHYMQSNDSECFFEILYNDRVVYLNKDDSE